MLFIVRFTDHVGLAQVRQQHLSAHLAWLAERQSHILVAGSLRPTPDAVPVGALWIVEAPSASEASALFETDPFWQQGLRQGVEVLHWSKAFPDLQALV